MPGLVGIIGRGPINNQIVLDRMLQSIRHEKFYSSGTFADELLGLSVGWAVHPRGFSDCMPIWNPTRTCVLFFHGEHHPDREQVARLAEFADMPIGGDARLVLRLYEQEGLRFLTRLNGCFQGILADLRCQQVFLFNDRLGMQRLYYADVGSSFVFSSEAKALLKICGALRRLDSRSVGEFLTCGCALENRTLFQEISTLPAGSCWTFQVDGSSNLADGSSKRARYFEAVEWEQQSSLPAKEIYEALPELIRSVVARHMSSGLPIGVSLSGGLDTRLIMAYLDDTNTGVSTYTFSGITRETYDVKIARSVAAACGRSHQVLSLNQEFLRNYPMLSARTVYMSDGGLGAEGAYELFFNQLARQVADIRVTGNYGSEVFRRVRQLGAFPPDRRMLNPDFAPQVDRAVATIAEYDKGHDLSFGVFCQAPWFGYGRLSIEQSQVIVRNPFLDNEFLRYMYRVPLELRNNSDLELHTIHQGNGQLLEIPTDRAERGRYGKMSSFLDHAWTWLIFKADYCYKSGMPQWLEQIHYLMRPLTLEKLVMGLHRFHYYRVWFRQELASHVRDILLDPATRARPYFNHAFIEQMVARHIKGDRNYTDQIERVLSLELIHRLLVEMPD
jgi:asparagine synthase (glutamine-hydrolysing)